MRLLLTLCFLLTLTLPSHAVVYCKRFPTDTAVPCYGPDYPPPASGTIGGSIAANQIAFGSGVNTIQGTNNAILSTNGSATFSGSPAGYPGSSTSLAYNSQLGTLALTNSASLANPNSSAILSLTGYQDGSNAFLTMQSQSVYSSPTYTFGSNYNSSDFQLSSDAIGNLLYYDTSNNILRFMNDFVDMDITNGLFSVNSAASFNGATTISANGNVTITSTEAGGGGVFNIHNPNGILGQTYIGLYSPNESYSIFTTTDAGQFRIQALSGGVQFSNANTGNFDIPLQSGYLVTQLAQNQSTPIAWDNSSAVQANGRIAVYDATGMSLLSSLNADGSAHITGKLTVDGPIDPTWIDLVQQTTPATNPASGSDRLYTKSDDKLYIKTAAGSESAVGTGTVTTVSVVNANGFSGTVANATTTPAITLGQINWQAVTALAPTGNVNWSSGAGYSAGKVWTATSGTTANWQNALGLVPGTYTDGKVCTYTSSGTVLNCNTTDTSSYWTLSSTNLFSPTADTVTMGVSSSTLDTATVQSTSGGLTVNQSTGFTSGTGGTITTYVSGGVTYKVHTFTSSGTFVAPSGNTSVQALVVAGGGGGAGGGGAGGAGGYQYNASYATTSLQSIAVTVGPGGAGGTIGGTTAGTSGSNSVFGTITSTGGGGGRASAAGLNGGSGGGGGVSQSGGTGTVGQGNNGGTGGAASGGFATAGGGGSAAVGGNGNSASNGGNGGAGTSNSITGTALFYAGGGGGSIDPGVQGTGGSSVGGAGKINGPGNAGSANTGSGGGSVEDSGTAGAGSTGVVIIAYIVPNDTPWLRFYAEGSQTGKIATDGNNSNFLTLTSGTTDVETFSSTNATLNTTLTLSTKNIITDTTTGTSFGTGTTQKTSAYGVTPVVQGGATTDLGTILSNWGLRAAGTAYPITTSGATNLSGTNTINGYVDLSTAQTLTNKRITKRIVTASDATSITPNSDNADITYQANTQTIGTLTINADGGAPTNGQSWTLKIKSTNVQTFSWNSVFVGGNLGLPTASTGSSKIDYFTFLYDTVNSKWDYTGSAGNF